MRNLYLKFILVFGSATWLNAMATYGQETKPGTKIQGKIVDSSSLQPVGYATITVVEETSQKTILGALANDKGEFHIERIPDGNYQVIVNFIGYARKTLSLATSGDKASTIALGKIALRAAAQQLDEVTVQGSRPLIENKIDRLVYNAENEVVTTVGDAADLLRKVPLLSVDMNGNVALRGNKNVKILIDGKTIGAMTGNTGDLLQSIPATQIKSVEVITSPSAKYDAEGSGGIVNIITRKKTIEGITSLAAAGIGTRQLTGSFNLTAKLHKVTLSMNGGLSNKFPRIAGVDFYSTDASGNHSTTQGSTRNTRLSNNLSATLSYDVDDRNSISSTFRRTSLGYNDDLNAQSTNNSVGQPSVAYQLVSASKDRSSGFDWLADYLHVFANKKTQLDIAARWSQNASSVQYQAIYSDVFTNQQAINHGRNNEYTAQIDLTHPVSKLLKLEVGAKAIFRRIESDYDYYNLDEAGNPRFNGLSANQFNYRQDVRAGYFVVNVDFHHGWGLQTGSRYEYIQINGESLNDQANAAPFAHQYDNLLPSAILSKALSENTTIKLSYNERIQRPSLAYLNPFRNTNDPLNQSQGTPQLSPEALKTVELGFNTTIRNYNLNAAVFYKRSDRMIESFVETVPYTVTDELGHAETRQVPLTRFGNIGTTTAWGLNFFGSGSFNKVFSVRASLNLYTYHASVAPQYADYLSPGTFLQYDGLLGSSYKFSKTLAAEVIYSFQSKQRTFQGTTANLNILNVGVKKYILKQQATVGLVAVNPFNNKWNFVDEIQTRALSQRNSFSTPFRSFNLNFAYRFGKLKMKSPAQRGVNNDDLKESTK